MGPTGQTGALGPAGGPGPAGGVGGVGPRGPSGQDFSPSVYPAFKYLVLRTLRTVTATARIVVPFDFPEYILNSTPSAVRTPNVGEFNIPLAGLYLINFTLVVSQAGQDAGNWIRSEVQINDKTVQTSGKKMDVQSPQVQTLSGFIIIPLTKDDKVKVVFTGTDSWIYGLQPDAGADPAAITSSTFIEFTYIRPMMEGTAAAATPLGYKTVS